MPINQHWYKDVLFKRKTTFILFILALSCDALGQNPEVNYQQQVYQIDSIKRTLPLIRSIARVDVLNKVSSMYCRPWDYDLDYRQTDSARRYAELAMREALEIDYDQGQVISLRNLGQVEESRGQFNKSAPYFQQATELSKKSNLRREFNELYIMWTYSLVVLGQYDSPEKNLESPLTYFRSVLDERSESSIFHMISSAYGLRGYYLKSFEYFQKEFQNSTTHFGRDLYSPEKMRELYLIEGDTLRALSYFRKTINYKIINELRNYNNMYDTYIMHLFSKEYDSVLHVLGQYRHLLEAYNDDLAVQKRWLMWNAVDLARAYNAMGNFDKTISLLTPALPYFEDSGDLDQAMNVLLFLSEASAAKRDDEGVLYYSRRLLDYAQGSDARPFMRDAYKLLAHAHDRRHDAVQANRFRSKYSELNSALNFELGLRKVAAANWIEKNDQHLAEVRLLDENNRIKQEQLQNESLMKKIYAGGLVVFGLLGAILFRNLLLKRKNEKLEGEKNRTLFQNQAIDLEMKALRSQMNPHFIFNSLNSINDFILQNNKAQASEYLTKFSRLIRLILQNSQASLISLESELEALRLYLDLEAVRFNYHFNSKIIVLPKLPIPSIMVPPLIIQPYVENAIWHGLMHKEEKGVLEIEVSTEGGGLMIKITDDGIGRKQASLFASKTATASKSMGLKITAERIARLQTPDQVSSVTINDLTDRDGRATGTEVIIKIPLIYD